jgi:hypothetical protein
MRPLRVSEAYRDGQKSGHADALLGRRSEYVYFTSPKEQNAYMREYAEGYRDAHRETKRGL